ncbi:MAG: retron St85 family effector protein [Caulobacteraceae bacterium]
MIAGDIPDIPEYVDVASIRVHAPTAVVIVCGGKTQIDHKVAITSLRDAFMRIAPNSNLSKYDIRRAEDIVQLPHELYDDLLQFESDIAQISELVLLFTESEGSFAELGAFSMDAEISSKLLVVVDKYNYQKDSFIRLGPLNFLETKNGEHSVCVIDLIDFGSERIENVSNLNLAAFEKFIEDKIVIRLIGAHEPRTFRKNRNGHLIKLMTGLVQHYGALTFDEIDTLMFCLEIDIDKIMIKKLLKCAELFQWIKADKVGIKTFYAAIAQRSAINYDFMTGVGKKNKAKLRSDIREFWKENDLDRFKCISDAALGV